MTMMPPNPKRGDVVLVLFPHSDLRTAEGQESGLLSDSVVMTDNLATVLENEIYRVIGHIPMTRIDGALRHTLGL